MVLNPTKKFFNILSKCLLLTVPVFIIGGFELYSRGYFTNTELTEMNPYYNYTEDGILRGIKRSNSYINDYENLPLGSIITIKDAKYAVLITGRNTTTRESLDNFMSLEDENKVINDTVVVYDYIGVPYPQGYLGANMCYVFNSEDVTNILSKQDCTKIEQDFIQWCEDYKGGKSPKSLDLSIDFKDPSQAQVYDPSKHSSNEDVTEDVTEISSEDSLITTTSDIGG